ncbi:MAG: sulfite exporter TauE/SafE family protein [Paracoccaceae bacterium]
MENEVLLIAVGALAGGFVNGLAGFGTALFALGFFLQALPPTQAVALSVVMSVFNGIPGLWVVRHSALKYPRRSLRFLIPAIIGIPLGTAALGVVDPYLLQLLIAGFMMIYGTFFLMRRSLPQFDRPTPVADGMVGFAGGVMGGLAGLSGALPAMWCALRPWPRHETRAVLQPFSVVILLITGGVLAWRGAYTSDMLPGMIVGVGVAGVSAQLGIFVFKRLSDTAFRWVLVGLMLLSGTVLMIRTLT